MNTEDFKITRKSYIYDMLNQLGILCSTETKVRNMMANSIPYSYTKIYNQTFMGKIYNKSYIYLPVSNLNNVELWFNGVYIYPKWVEC